MILLLLPYVFRHVKNLTTFSAISAIVVLKRSSDTTFDLFRASLLVFLLFHKL